MTTYKFHRQQRHLKIEHTGESGSGFENEGFDVLDEEGFVAHFSSNQDAQTFVEADDMDEALWFSVVRDAAWNHSEEIKVVDKYTIEFNGDLERCVPDLKLLLKINRVTQEPKTK